MIITKISKDSTSDCNMGGAADSSTRLAKELSDLSFRAKAHWGYSAELMESWRNDLTIGPEYFETHQVFTSYIDKQLVAYYAYCKLEACTVLLDNIFVEPAFIGKGIGKALLDHLKTQVKSTENNLIRLYSEPHAKAFYSKFGFVLVGEKATSVKNRFLPIMELTLK
ncbi:GNAT family N-acetyltransferase [Glaciecola petra]|uniref:GNAT family N-acetyltransferase n=1 Tax=Glaciecola petra TaxID=3075602 RepID=A0ABU2ZSU9_9ALTE|nr:GNAT family N-acetyltransferase [Aestuariibacter sp. P117]MDT0595713.1 GNAT family N-acetyltransferase [Aestuariibacter sp. P117]